MKTLALCLFAALVQQPSRADTVTPRQPVPSLPTAAPGEEPPVVIIRGPYLQSAGADRITVRWRTDLPGTTVVRYGDAPGNLTATLEMPEEVTEHVANLVGLPPDTAYFYQIQTTTAAGSVITAGDDADHFFTTHPLPGTRRPTRLWITGDTGTLTPEKQRVYEAYLARTAGLKTDAWLMLGDNAYEDGTDAEFQGALFDSYARTLRHTSLWSCIGNHETVTDNGAPYLDLHTFPTRGESGGTPSGTERYYSFDQGNIHFIAVDSETAGNYNDLPGTGGMIDWLEADLRATRQDWIIAFMHHGPYTRGTVDSDSTEHLVEMRQYVVPLLEKYGTDLVLSGHSHVYERSKLIRGHHGHMSAADSSSATFDPALHVLDGGNGSTRGRVDASGNFTEDGGDGAYEKPLAAGDAGTIYITCGASGKLSGWVNGSSETLNPTPHPVTSVGLLAMGSLLVEVAGNELHARYIDDSGSLRDDFTLRKGSAVEIDTPDATFGELGGDDTATIRVTRSGATGIAEEISYAAAGSAVPGVDFSPALGGAVSFTAGETAKWVTLRRLKDSLAEGPETIDVTLVEQRSTVAGGTGLRSSYFLGTRTAASVTLLDAPAQQWWFTSFGPAEIASQDWQLDGDGDGLGRLEELAFGGVEGVDDRFRRPYLTASPEEISLNYFRDPAVAGIRYEPLRSTNLTDWETSGFTNVRDGPADPAGLESWKSSTAIDLERGFLRLKIELED